MQWKGSLKATTFTNESLYAKRQKRADILVKGRSAVPSLFDTCIAYIVENIDHVESLGPAVGADVRAAICHKLVDVNEMNGTTLQAVCEAGMDSLEICDASIIMEADLVQALGKMEDLQYLSLDQAGPCFGTKVVDALSGGNKSLFAISVGGAYLFKDKDAARLVKACAPSSLGFKACPLVGRSLCQSILDTYTSTPLMELLLEDLPTLTEEHFQATLLSSDGTALQNLKSLSLRRLDGLRDATVTAILKEASSSLKGLDLSDNQHLTDTVLSRLRLYGAPCLQSLTLSGLKQLTAPGLEALFTFVEGDAKSPPTLLRTLALANCDLQAVTDTLLELVTAMTKGGTNNNGGLSHLDVQGSPLLTDTAMEHLAAASRGSLETLNISYCPRITDQGIGYLVDTCVPQLTNLQVWGNAQLTDDFLDGNRRASDPTLEIVGVWMKSCTGRTVR